MTKIFCSPPSPYSAKVRMAATWLKIPFDSELVDTNVDPASLIAANPLGKIPVLVGDDGQAVQDSRAIMQHLNRMSGGGLFPRNAAKRMEAERLEALADGIADCALAHVYERRFRPVEKVHQPWLDRQWAKVERGLDVLEAAPPRFGARIHGGHIALRAVLGYLQLRFAGQWEKGRGKLVRWAKRFDSRFPELVAFIPA